MIRVCIGLLCCGVLGAATLPSGFSEVQLVSGLAFPTAMEFSPDGRLFVCEKGGQLRVIKNGTLLAAPFVTVTVNELGERGVLGIAFDPNFAANQYVYVYYTATTPSVHNRVSRFTAAGDVAVFNSELVLLDLEPLNATNHNGGAIHFGSDGMLYIGVGENAVGSNSQSMTTRLGKMLRIAPDGSIPTNNPFYNTAVGANRAILALGLRNPFTFAVQPGTGRIFINDVGGTSWEEINEGIAGSNYGWPNTEGTTTNPLYRSPLYTYPHSGGTVNGCAVTGGTFYDPPVTQFPGSYVGKYFFADLCGWIKLFDPAAGTVTAFATDVANVVDLKTGPDGMLYYLSMGSAAVYRVQATTSEAPVISTQPASMTAGVGQSATFTVTASGAALSYQWQSNGVPIAGANSSSYTLTNPQLGDSGTQYSAVVSNTFGSATSNTATLTVTSNQPPVATILTPASGSLYNAAQVIAYSGSATDPDGGSFPASAFTWQVDFHHDTHMHPFLPSLTGLSGSFTIPNTGETATNVWYRVYLTVTDSGGLTNTTFRDIQPRLQTFQMLTSPAGLQLTLDDQPIATAASVTSVVGMIRTLGVVTPQVSGGKTYTFTRWSDNGAATHNIVTPSSSTIFYGALFGLGSSPGFTLSGSPVSSTVTAGATASYTVTATPAGGFAGSINLSASGLPVGAGATFGTSPISAAGSSSLNVSTLATTPSGTYTLTITGSEAGGTLTSTTTVTLVVSAVASGSFTLSASPASVTIAPGGVATYTISVLPANGFSSPVSFSTSMPASIASFSPAAAASPAYTSVLTVTPPPATMNANINLTVTGTGGGLTRTTTVNLRIVP